MARRISPQHMAFLAESSPVNTLPGNRRGGNNPNCSLRATVCVLYYPEGTEQQLNNWEQLCVCVFYCIVLLTLCRATGWLLWTSEAQATRLSAFATTPLSLWRQTLRQC